jgi:zinc protease
VKRAAVAVLLLCAFTGLALGQLNIQFTEFTLPNGLHVILHEDHSAPIVAQVVAYHVGSKNEQPDRTGFAHFFEHLMFEGTDHIPRGNFDKIVDNAGGSLNAFTSFDQTVFFISVPSNQLELALWMESDRMINLLVDSAGIETQRSVVKEERKQRIDNQPYGSILEETFSHAFSVHPYRWVPIGSAQYIDRATYDEFQLFYRRFYVPENACLVIAGDIDLDWTKKAVQKYFGDIPPGRQKIVRPSIVEPPQAREVRDTVYDNIQLPAVVMAYHMPAQGTPDSYALSMLTTLLSGGESSRLTKRLVDKERLAVVAQTIPLSLEDPALFIVFAVANMGKSLGDIEHSIEEEISAVQTELISETEFQKIRSQVETGYVGKAATVLGKAQELATYYQLFGDASLINTELERYMAVSREDIRRVAREYLQPTNRVVLHYLPESQTQ